MKEKVKKLFQKIKSTAKLFLNIRYLVCYGLAWLTVHGWEYAIGLVGLIIKSEACISIFLSIYAFTCLPFVPENIVLTFPLSIIYQGKLFPQDDNLKKQLTTALEQAKGEYNARRKQREQRKLHKKSSCSKSRNTKKNSSDI